MKTPRSLLCHALLLFMLGVPSLMGQSKAELLYKKAYDARSSDTAARPIYEEIIANHTGSVVYPEALFHLGHILLEEGEAERAETMFRLVVEGDFSNLGEEGEGKEEWDNIGDRYTNYKHSASLQLARLYMESRRFQEALGYIALADTVHRYQHFCGTCMRGRRIGFVQMYADCYEGMGKVDDAIRILKPYTEGDWLPFDNGILKRYVRLMSTRYTREEQRRIAEDAAARIEIVHRDAEEEEESSWWVDGYADLFGAKIRLFPPSPDATSAGEPHAGTSDEEWREYHRGIFRNSYVYKFLYNGEY